MLPKVITHRNFSPSGGISFHVCPLSSLMMLGIAASLNRFPRHAEKTHSRSLPCGSVRR